MRVSVLVFRGWNVTPCGTFIRSIVISYSDREASMWIVSRKAYCPGSSKMRIELYWCLDGHFEFFAVVQARALGIVRKSRGTAGFKR